MNKVMFFFSIFFVVILQYFYVNSLTQQFKLCHPQFTQSEYYISPPHPCVRHQQETIHKCSAKIFNPSDTLIQVPVHVCQLYTTTWTTTYWFFGSKTHDSSVSAADPPPPQLCHLWSETLQAPGIGTLKRQSTNIWATQNKVHYSYSWPREKTGSVKNAMLTKTIATYDPLRKLMKSAMGSMSTCNVVKGFCKVGTRLFIWAPPPNANCPQADSMGTQDLLLHYHKQSLYRIEIPTLHLSVHSQTQCSSLVKQCYGAKTICDPAGLMIIPNNCTAATALVHHDVLSPFLRNYTNRRRFSGSIVSRFVTESSDLMREKIRNLTSDIHFVECQLQALLTTLFSLMSRQYPGDTLSSLTGQRKAAITAGDVLTEITCQTVEGIVLQSLKQNEMYSSRPLVEFNINGTRKIGQIWPDGFLYVGVQFKEKYVPGKLVTFRINDMFYVFENYTLRHLDRDVKQLNPTLYHPKFQSMPVDYSEALNLFPVHNDQYDDVQNMLLTISELQQDRNSIREFLLSNSESDSFDIDYTGKVFGKTISNIFISVISAITNPILSGIFTVLTFLSLFWSLVLTVMASKHFLAICANKRRGNARPPSDDPEL